MLLLLHGVLLLLLVLVVAGGGCRSVSDDRCRLRRDRTHRAAVATAAAIASSASAAMTSVSVTVSVAVVVDRFGFFGRFVPHNPTIPSERKQKQTNRLKINENTEFVSFLHLPLAGKRKSIKERNQSK